MVKPFLAFLQSTVLVPKNIHIFTPWPQNVFISFFAYEYKKYAEFFADFKSMERIGKSAPRESYLSETFAS